MSDLPRPGGGVADGLPRLGGGVAGQPVGQVDASVVPRFVGQSTFARLPRIADLPDGGRAAVAVLGVPFDGGVTYRPGARFGPAHIRQSSRLLRPFNPELGIEPFAARQVADAGDLAVNPFSIAQAIATIEAATRPLADAGTRLLTLGGDHTIALPLLRSMHAAYGEIAVLHFDAHLDTWDTYFGEPYTHGTPFRRAAEERLINPRHCLHVGIRGPLYSADDLPESADLGFETIHCAEFETLGTAEVIARMRERLGDGPIYVSVDIDVLDPAFAPGTGTPEAGGLTSRELLAILRGLAGANVVSADIVEVSPAYDHAEITGIAAAHVGYELLSVLSGPCVPTVPAPTEGSADARESAPERTARLPSTARHRLPATAFPRPLDPRAVEDSDPMTPIR